MPGILADMTSQGQVEVILRLLEKDWRGEIWHSLQFGYVTFAEVGLVPKSSDRLIWETCQKNKLFLITENRNADGPDSLEETIRTCNTADFLPVFTIASGKRVMKDREYAERVADRLLGYLFEFEKHLGTGRLYLP